MSVISRILISTLVIFLMASCERSENSENSSVQHITLIVPAQFKGVFAIKEDRSSPNDLGETGERVKITIPPEGEIYLRSTRFLETWHSTTVRTEDGVEFPNGMLKQDETLSFYYLWTNTEGTTYFLIGDHDAYLAAQKIGRVEPLQKFD